MEAYNVFGMPELEILEECDKEHLSTRELYYMHLWGSVENGFNSAYSSAGGVSKGELNPKSLYTDEKIVYIARYILANKKVSLARVSADLSVKYSVVKSIASGKTHKWLEEVISEEYSQLLELAGTRSNSGDRQGASKFTNTQILNAFLMLLEDITVPNNIIAQKCGITESAVVALTSGSNYSWIREKYPEEYKQLIEALKLKRSYSRSAKARGIVYPPIISPFDGSVHYIDNVNKFAKENGLDTGSLNKVLNKKAGSTKGWKLL
jgi:hypothetical protein